MENKIVRKYDVETFIDPVPIVHTIIINPDNDGQHQNVLGLIDTGAEFCAIPKCWIKPHRKVLHHKPKPKFDLYPHDYVEDMSGFNSRSDSLVYFVHIVIDEAGIKFRQDNIEVILNDTFDNLVLIGRNFLRKYSIYLEGNKSQGILTISED